MSRVQLEPARCSAGQLLQISSGQAYAAHQLLWRLFSSGEGEDAEKARPFLYRQLEDSRAPTFYLLSEDVPEDRDAYWQVATKPFEPRLKMGMRLQFDLRVNPVKKSRDEAGRQHRHDLVMDMKRELRNGAEEIDMPALQQAAGLKWVASRAEQYGFRLVDNALLADGYRQHRFHPGKKKSPIRFSSLDVKGLLEITDVHAFETGLLKGIGPAKSFGCGLLLIRPA